MASTTARAHPRYRVEHDQHIIDVRVAALEQLFDNRDPAPFRRRDLDPELIEYLVSAAEDLIGHGQFRVVFWLQNPARGDEIEPAYRAHLEYEIERLGRRRRRHRRTGEIELVIGATLLVILLSLAQLAGGPPDPGVATVVREGLTILGWVVMWRPVEALLYDWVPIRRARKVFEHLLAAPIEIREGVGTAVT